MDIQADSPEVRKGHRVVGGLSFVAHLSPEVQASSSSSSSQLQSCGSVACAGAAMQAQAKAAPLSHQASHKPPDVQVCLVIYGFSLNVENIC